MKNFNCIVCKDEIKLLSAEQENEDEQENERGNEQENEHDTEQENERETGEGETIRDKSNEQTCTRLQVLLICIIFIIFTCFYF